MERKDYFKKIDEQFSVHPICALLGPRQVGKTTLAKEYAKFYNKTVVFDLEFPPDLARLENPVLAFSGYEETLIIIDEIQLRPELFPILRVLVDDKSSKNRYLILGSASKDLIRQSS